jgi:hypothetical protein
MSCLENRPTTKFDGFVVWRAKFKFVQGWTPQTLSRRHHVPAAISNPQFLARLGNLVTHRNKTPGHSSNRHIWDDFVEPCYRFGRLYFFNRGDALKRRC